jgi:hypothetical protein
MVRHSFVTPSPAEGRHERARVTDRRCTRRGPEANGLSVAMNSLERRAAADSLILQSGVSWLTRWGRQALTSSGGDPAVLGECRPAFASGCYHGVVEALLRLRGLVDMAELQRMCAEAGKRGGARSGARVRARARSWRSGRGRMDIDATSSLRYPGYARFVNACREGAFMEAITAALSRPSDHPAHAHGSHVRDGGSSGWGTRD